MQKFDVAFKQLPGAITVYADDKTRSFIVQTASQTRKNPYNK